MDTLHIAAFSDGDNGGNPAGVLISNQHPPASDMQQIANDVGFSETAFSYASDGKWRVRYFSLESEVPFCGHATIALGAALAMEHGNGVYELELNDANITVEGRVEDGVMTAALQSPPTHHKPLSESVLAAALDLFGLTQEELDTRIPPVIAGAGATHIVLALTSRERLAAMSYDLGKGRAFMNANSLVTITLAFMETPQVFHVRNPFASGGVYEDPATGAAAAALAGYLRDTGRSSGNAIDIVQGEDMGQRSLLRAEFSDEPGSSIRVSGSARLMTQ
ncbi:MAG: PhzF family phenazine biosynthesis protein [Alphaproteobacteria bacterium]|nr:PhzF family phenazine biosynthesis protein [Alphaproteobacteria bacterium]